MHLTRSVGTLLLVSGCSLAIDLSDYAGPPGGAATLPDGGTDGGRAIDSVDGGRDATSAADGGVPLSAPCSAQPATMAYCNDFDGVPPTGTAINSGARTGASIETVDGTIRARAPQRGSGGNDFANFDGEIGDVARSIRVAFRVRPAALPPPSQEPTYLFHLVIGDGNDDARYLVAISSSTTRSVFAQIEPNTRDYTDDELSRPIKMAEWTSLEIDLVLAPLAGGAPSVTVRSQEDGEAAPVTVLQTTLERTWVRTGPVKTRFGIVYSANPHVAIDVSMDSVRVLFDR